MEYISKLLKLRKSIRTEINEVIENIDNFKFVVHHNYGGYEFKDYKIFPWYPDWSNLMINGKHIDLSRRERKHLSKAVWELVQKENREEQIEFQNNSYNMIFGIPFNNKAKGGIDGSVCENNGKNKSSRKRFT